jgi:hypothetical protein
MSTPKLKTMTGALICLAAARLVAQEPAWNGSAARECDRACTASGTKTGTRRSTTRRPAAA